MKTRTRKSSSERRAEIAAATLQIIGERGLPSLTTAVLAREVGLSSGALFRHFPSLDAILAAAADLAIERLEASFPDATLPPLARLFALTRGRVELLSAQPGIAWLLRSDQAPLVLPSAAVERLQALVARSRQFLLETLQAGRAAGQIRTDLDTEVLMVLLMGAVHALVGMRGLHREASADSPVERVLTGLQLLLRPPHEMETCDATDRD